MRGRIAELKPKPWRLSHCRWRRPCKMRRRTGTKGPSIRTYVLAQDDNMKALLLLLAVPLLGFAQAKPARKYIKPEGPTPRPFNEAVVVGNTMYVAGHIGLDPKTGKPPADV